MKTRRNNKMPKDFAKRVSDGLKTYWRNRKAREAEAAALVREQYLVRIDNIAPPSPDSGLRAAFERLTHKRPNGTQCSYMADTFCNKCGWHS